MKVILLDSGARDAFLADPRLGILALVRPCGTAVAIPLWYGWDGMRVTMISERRSAKVGWLTSHPQASLLVTNIDPEPPRWVAFDGMARIEEHGQEAAERLAGRYLRRDQQGEIRAALERFRRVDLVQITLEPNRIRTYAEID